MMRHTFKRACTVLPVLLVVMICGCTTVTATRGNVPDMARLAQLETGQSDSDDVARILGTPSFTGLFEDKPVWYYVSQTTDQQAFMQPDVVDRQVVSVHFDKTGVLSFVEISGKNAGFDVTPIDRETPSGGRKLNVVEQLLGNLGRGRIPQ